MARDVSVVVGVGGMGEAIARNLDPEHQILIADFSQQNLDAVQAALESAGFTVTAHLVDVSSQTSVRELAAAAAGLGAVRTVVWTAGLSPSQAPTEAILRVDLLGVAYGLEEFGAVIADGGAGIVIASMAGTLAATQLPAELGHMLAVMPAEELGALPMLNDGSIPDPGAAYGLAKRANQLRVQSASLAWGRRGARVNSISPGVISTPMGEQELADESGAMMRAMVAASGTGRLGTPEDILHAALFLLGPDSTFITGIDLLVDGGVVAAVSAGALSPAAS